MVNVDRIIEVHPWFHGDFAVELRDGTRLSLSRTYRPKFDAAVSQFSA
jgi:DNA-binding LytR/AlgR family response regulator